MHKACFKCDKTLPLTEFYPHPRMGDGHLNKCKECTRSDTMQNRRRRADYYREYDRSRSDLPHRVARQKETYTRQKTKAPQKYLARRAAQKALQDGLIRREPCYFCGSTTELEMHHPDYSNPLRVYWLCRPCHRKVDNMTKLGVAVGSNVDSGVSESVPDSASSA